MNHVYVQAHESELIEAARQQKLLQKQQKDAAQVQCRNPLDSAELFAKISA